MVGVELKIGISVDSGQILVSNAEKTQPHLFVLLPRTVFASNDPSLSIPLVSDIFQLIGG